MPISFMASFISLIHSRSFGASPRKAVSDDRKKLLTETPGISTGYCIAKNKPALALSSTDISKTSAPSSVTEPDGIVYLG